MASLLRRALKAVTPPVVVSLGHRVLAERRTEWIWAPTWPSDDAPGWNDPSVVSTQLARWDSYVASVKEPLPIGLGTDTNRTATSGDYAVHNTAMAFGYVLLLAAGGRTRLSLLDWGGGLGQYAVLARALAPDTQIEYHCRELPRLVEGGRRVLPEDYHHASDEEALARRYDLVVASGALHYVHDWQKVLGGLAGATGRYLYITRQPTVTRVGSFVVMQRAHRHGYRTEYPGWFLNRHEFLQTCSQHQLKLRREFLIAEEPHVMNAPEHGGYRGFLFERAD